MRDDDPPISDRHLERLGRYLAGKASDAESAELRAELADARIDVARLDTVASLLAARESLESAASPAAERLDDLHRRLGLSGQESRPSSRRPSSSSRRGPLGSHATWIAVVAIVLVLFGISLEWVSHHHTRTTDVVGHTYATGAAHRMNIALPDGSQVTLAPYSTLTIGGASGVFSRTVSLTGEAYFDVTHDPRHPFVVRSNQVTTRVLGTTFDVRAYPNESAVQVVVSSGTVESQQPGKPTVTITAGMVTRMTDSGATTMRAGAMAEYIGWTKGYVEFHNVPVAKALATLEPWYGVHFKMMDSSWVDVHITARLPITSPQETMQILKLLLGADMTYDLLGDHTLILVRPRHPRLNPNPPIVIHPSTAKTESSTPTSHAHSPRRSSSKA
jgi:ferric-dicitrate binding protein FerR (iron transport regulator)